MIKQLGTNDWKQMALLRCQKATHAGASVRSFTSTPLVHINTRYMLEPNVAFGWFEDEKLKAFICAYSADDFWVLDLMVSSEKPTQLHACLAACLDYYESLGIFKFFYAFPKKWARAYKSFWRDSVKALQKYEIEDIKVLEANKIPAMWEWEHILHQVIVPVPLLLRCSRCKTLT